MLFVTPIAKIVTLALFNCPAGIAGAIPLLDLPSVKTKITFLAPLLAPAAALKRRLLRTSCRALPVAVRPPVYLVKIECRMILLVQAYRDEESELDVKMHT